MGGFGVMQYAKQVTASNRSILKRRGKFGKTNNMFERLNEARYTSNRIKKYKKAKPELLAAIRKRIREENRNQRRTRLILVGICTTMAFIGLWLILTL